jgi:uncharacterized alpha-E superfamily protein
MISRVAESSFWLARYLERVENFTRIIAVNHHFLLDHALQPITRWQPIIKIFGEQTRFTTYFPNIVTYDENEIVQNYCIWDQRNPSSLLEMVKAARENARVIRDTLNTEMWEGLNKLWLWLNQEEGRNQYDQYRDNFYQYLIEHCQIFQGLLQTTLRQDESFTFLTLGLMLERSIQILRVIDISYYANENELFKNDRVLEETRWFMILKCLCANTSLLKTNAAYEIKNASFEFLLRDSLFPRSVYFCLEHAYQLLRELREKHHLAAGQKSIQKMIEVIDMLDHFNAETISHQMRHNCVTQLITYITQICNNIACDFFTHTSKDTAIS